MPKFEGNRTGTKKFDPNNNQLIKEIQSHIRDDKEIEALEALG